MTDLAVSCDCGAFQGRLKTVTPKAGTHMVCYCDDCQAFAEYLDHSDTVLDAKGGTDIYQTLPARLEIETGGEHLACVQVTDKGTLRWYTSCCQTPIGNTLKTPALPFLGLVTTCLRPAPDGTPPQEAMGPSNGVVFEKFARGDVSDQPSAMKFSILLPMVMRIAGAKVFGGRHTPFFGADKQPTAQPHRLSAEDRQAIDDRLAARRWG